MTLAEFLDSTKKSTPPPQISPPLLALWMDARGEWDAAHASVQNESSADAEWVHAYLHRKEGDASNARYWYHRAGKPENDGSLDNEWAEIAGALLAQDRA